MNDPFKIHNSRGRRAMIHIFGPGSGSGDLALTIFMIVFPIVLAYLFT